MFSQSCGKPDCYGTCRKCAPPVLNGCDAVTLSAKVSNMIDSLADILEFTPLTVANEHDISMAALYLEKAAATLCLTKVSRCKACGLLQNDNDNSNL